MANIEFSSLQKQTLVLKLQHYLQTELDLELGQFDAEFLLDFIGKEFASYFYNQGLYDAQALLQSRFDSLSDAIYDLEQSTEFSR
ncbi:MAG: DUF2164 domain-containing protein [Paraglaciecola sp.]|nr:DUF2164 domain-containing protein [Paraglaciecola sp.]NCT48850.1 DUF2164 domain-containing protein [Paraglaciecola sp.]